MRLGSTNPRPKKTKKAHFHLNGLNATQNVNHQRSSRYVKKSNAPVGAIAFRTLVISIQRSIQNSDGRVSGSMRNMSSIRVYMPMCQLPTVPMAEI
ncbi:hypothetical protein RRF57_009190 [Xylaria bambusicola]|uniref:Uncharacterized protein n=1 Tax=Xylaria bambusicola TaxID=326684 RepID=A0AAN7UWG6_9PEZI